MELMVTLTLVALLVAIAAPNFRSFMLNSRMTGSANDLLSSIQLARSEAIKRQLPVAICGSDNPEAGLPACTAQFTGWVVWADADDDAAIDAGEFVISTHERVNNVSLYSNGNGFASFAPNGFSRISIGGNPATTLVLMCDERRNQLVGDTYRKRAVALSPTGRPTVLKTAAEFAPHGAAGNCPEA